MGTDLYLVSCDVTKRTFKVNICQHTRRRRPNRRPRSVCSALLDAPDSSLQGEVQET